MAFFLAELCRHFTVANKRWVLPRTSSSILGTVGFFAKRTRPVAFSVRVSELNGTSTRAPGGIRTPDLLVRSQTFYPLNYERIFFYIKFITDCVICPVPCGYCNAARPGFEPGPTVSRDRHVTVTPTGIERCQPSCNLSCIVQVVTMC